MSQVSIVIPVRNRPELIGRCLDSVKAQSLRPLDVIVVDNGSTDNTRESVAGWIAQNAGVGQDPGFKVMLLEEKTQGAAAARNRGLAAVASPYVIFFDSDDVMHPRLAEKALAAIGDADIVYWKGEVIGLDGKRHMKPFGSGNLLRRQLYNCPLSTQLYMSRTDLICDAGGWDEDLPGWNDWELGVRLLLYDPKAVALPECLTTIFAQEKSITGKKFSDKAGVWEAAIDSVEADIVASGRHDTARLLEMVDYRRAILGAHYHRENANEAAYAVIRKALNPQRRGFFKSLWLLALCHYTAAGGRGAYRLWRR